MTRKLLKSCMCCFLGSHQRPLILSLDWSHTVRETLGNWVLPKEAVHSGLPFYTHSQVEGQAAHTHSLSLISLHCWPDPAHLSHKDLEGNMGGVPHSCHSWDTQCIISENTGHGVSFKPRCAVLAKQPSRLAADAPLFIYDPDSGCLASVFCLCYTNPASWSYLFYCVVLFTIKDSVVIRNWNEVACCLDGSFYFFPVLA